MKSQTINELEKSHDMEEGYRAFDAVIQEIANADQEIIEHICKRLREENKFCRNRAIDDVCMILDKLNRMPSVELLDEAIAVLCGINLPTFSTVQVLDICFMRLVALEEKG